MAASELASIMCMAPLGGKDGKGGPQKPKSPGTKIHSPCRCGSGQKNLTGEPNSVPVLLLFRHVAPLRCASGEVPNGPPERKEVYLAARGISHAYFSAMLRFQWETRGTGESPTPISPHGRGESPTPACRWYTEDLARACLRIALIIWTP